MWIFSGFLNFGFQSADILKHHHDGSEVFKVAFHRLLAFKGNMEKRSHGLIS